MTFDGDAMLVKPNEFEQRKPMLTRYIQAVRCRAHYETIEDGTYYGEIPGFDGVYADADSLEACRTLLQEVPEGWLLVSFDQHISVAVIDGIDLTVSKDVASVPRLGPISRRELVGHWRRLGSVMSQAG